MAPLDLDRLQQQIRSENLSWRVRVVPDDEPHSLGFEPSVATQLAASEAVGATLLQALQLNPTALSRNRLLDPSVLAKFLRVQPRRFDWRDRGVIGAVTDQRWCGSCVSFATAGLVSAQAAIELGVHDLDLSEADQHFCSSHGAHCGGWNNHDSLDQVRQRGISTEASFPYMSAFDSPPQVTNPADPNSLWAAHCRAQRLRRAYSITNFTAHTGDDRKTYLSTVGPMICGFTVFEDFDVYAGGVFRHVTGKSRGGHAVLVVGYDDDRGCWICRNSWGTGFGGAAQPDGTGAGFFELGYGDSGIDGEAFFGCTGVVAPRPIDVRLLDLAKLKDIKVLQRPLPIPGPGPVEDFVLRPALLR
ncbi:C1 family peptidase [Luteimicrobium sp. DT211]|uniref:C1 family peptidase n=1 Tax=Luteimicrobium sp. DT211 TaxID=3393412 RepID=UPI003CE8C5AE